MNRAELKTKAKESLKGHWGNIIIIMLISGAISGICGGISGYNSNGDGSMTLSLIASLVSMAATVYMEVVATYYELKVSRNESVTLKEAFGKKELFVPFLVISILVGIICWLGFMLLIVPGIIFGLAFSLVYFIKIDNPELSAIDAMKKSWNMMKGHKGELFVLGLSFIGWILLICVTIGIAAFYVAPYMGITFCNFYNKLKEQNA